MKKLMFMLAAIVMMALTSCGSTDPSKINEKIQAGETLSQTDYKEMLKYVGAAFKEIIDQTQHNGDKNFNEVLEQVYAKYPLCEVFMQYLTINEGKLDADNMKLLDSVKTPLENLIESSNTQPEVVTDEIEEIIEIAE